VGIDNSLKITILVFLVFNSLLGKSSEIMFAFLNTLQIIDYFPLLNLTIPQIYSDFLWVVHSSNLDILGMLSNFKVPSANLNFEYVEWIEGDTFEQFDHYEEDIKYLKWGIFWKDFYENAKPILKQLLAGAILTILFSGLYSLFKTKKNTPLQEIYEGGEKKKE